jgi:hypothetical protein
VEGTEAPEKDIAAIDDVVPVDSSEEPPDLPSGDDADDAVASPNPGPLHLALPGGGWHSHTALAGWFMGKLEASALGSMASSSILDDAALYTTAVFSTSALAYAGSGLAPAANLAGSKLTFPGGPTGGWSVSR